MVLEAAVRESPESAKLLCALAIAYAGLRLDAEARNTAAKVLAMVPIDREPYFGQSVLQQTSLVYTMLGDYEAALDGLEMLLGMPSAISIPWLRLDPRWAPLWELPRFQELAEKYG